MREGREWGPIPTLLLAALLLAGAEAARSAPEFDGPRAQRWIEEQCRLGPRVPGTRAHRLWLERMEGYLDSLGLTVERIPFRYPSPLGPDTLQLTNLMASAAPGRRPRLLLGAHWDSRPWCDEDPDPDARDTPVLGANDGASGTAVLLVLGKILAETPPPIGVDLVFFDGEDLGKKEEAKSYALGSQWVAATWSGPFPDWVLVLDMIGSPTMVLGRELTSWKANPDWVELIFQVAREKGYQEWNRDVTYRIFDDHIPFLRKGVPSALLIGFNDRNWHTRRDVPSETSPRSLGRVGAVVTSLIYDGYLVP
jgi:glutaminyl-peptide cyclotransferase